MLALAVTFLAALYLLGPDLLSRAIISYAAPRKSAPANRGEEITRAVLWAAFPLAVSIFWCWLRRVLLLWGRWAAVDNVYTCLSGSCSGVDRTNLPASLRGVLGMNLSLLWREYLLVVFSASLFAAYIRHFGFFWRASATYPVWRKILLWSVNAEVADWHVWLSDMLLPQPGLDVFADVLTKNGTLYQGIVNAKAIASDGTLQSLTLVSPRRYLREEFHQARSQNVTANRDTFWQPIPGDVFVLLGSDMVNLNIHYVSTRTEPGKAEPDDTQKSILRSITEKVAAQSANSPPPAEEPLQQEDWHPNGDELR